MAGQGLIQGAIANARNRLFDLLIWNIVPSQTTSIGAAIIVSSGLYIVYRERLHSARSSQAVT